MVGAGLLPAGAPGAALQAGPALRLCVGLAFVLGTLPAGSPAPWEAEAGWSRQTLTTAPPSLHPCPQEPGVG